MDFKHNNPNDIFLSQWNQLELAVKDAKHNYHLFALSTIDANSPDLRTVVLRNVNKNKYSISFHTDIRSPKFKQITKNTITPGLINARVRTISADPGACGGILGVLGYETIL